MLAAFDLRLQLAQQDAAPEIVLAHYDEVFNSWNKRQHQENNSEVKNRVFSAYFEVAQLYEVTQNYEKALEYLIKAEQGDHADTLTDASRADILWDQHHAHERLGQYKEAIRCALRFSELTTDTNRKADAYGAIGGLYVRLARTSDTETDNLTQAQHYLNLALELATEWGVKAYIYSHMAAIYKATGDTVTYRETLLKVRDACHKAQPPEWVARLLAWTETELTLI